MTNPEVNNIPFKSGMILWIKGLTSELPTSFSINVGTDEKNIALYLKVCFNETTYKKVIIMNYEKAGVWGQEVRVTDFYFRPGQEFEMTITFNDKFNIQLPGDHMVTFPNKLGAMPYNKIWVNGDVTVNGISIK